MINYEALFKVTYGMYLICSGDQIKGNGFISNTFFQVTAEPPTFATCCNKKNFTTSIIEEKGAFSVSVLHTEAIPDIFGRFGYRNGKDFNKFEGMQVKYGLTGVPIVLNECLAYLELKVIQKVDAGTHFIFIAELNHAELIDNNKESMTYDYYRKVRKGMSPKNAPTYIEKSKLLSKS